MVAQPTAGSGALLLADISGYTSFLQLVVASHQNDAFADGAVPDAYQVVSSLLGGIVECLVPPFTLAGLEGDAVFTFASASDVERGTAALDPLRDCYADFQRRLETAHDIWTCTCDACARIDNLDLKFVLHAGQFVKHEIAGRQELAGPDVVMAHRLLKSNAADVAESGAYMLVTEAAATWFDVPADAARPIVETYEHYPPISAHVFPLPA